MDNEGVKMNTGFRSKLVDSNWGFFSVKTE